MIWHDLISLSKWFGCSSYWMNNRIYIGHNCCWLELELPRAWCNNTPYLNESTWDSREEVSYPQDHQVQQHMWNRLLFWNMFLQICTRHFQVVPSNVAEESHAAKCNPMWNKHWTGEKPWPEVSDTTWNEHVLNGMLHSMLLCKMKNKIHLSIPLPVITPRVNLGVVLLFIKYIYLMSRA